jgi:hypothetical protein
MNPLTWPNPPNQHTQAGVASCNQGGKPCSRSILGNGPNGCGITENYQPIAQQSMQQAMNNAVDGAQMGYLPSAERASVMDAGGQMEQPIVYDRFVFANQKSRLYGLGDPIRGDIPIAPNKSDWFQVSVHPNTDLRAGAMNIMGGMNNTTQNEVYALQNLSTGRVDVNNFYQQSINPATSQKMSTLSMGQGTIDVSAFP